MTGNEVGGEPRRRPSGSSQPIGGPVVTVPAGVVVGRVRGRVRDGLQPGEVLRVQPGLPDGVQQAVAVALQHRHQLEPPAALGVQGEHAQDRSSVATTWLREGAAWRSWSKACATYSSCDRSHGRSSTRPSAPATVRGGSSVSNSVRSSSPAAG